MRGSVAEKLPRKLDKRLFGEGFVEEDGRTSARGNSNPHETLPDYYRDELEERVRKEQERVEREEAEIRRSGGGRSPKVCLSCPRLTTDYPAKMVRKGWKKLGGGWLCPRCWALRKTRQGRMK